MLKYNENLCFPYRYQERIASIPFFGICFRTNSSQENSSTLRKNHKNIFALVYCVLSTQSANLEEVNCAQDSRKIKCWKTFDVNLNFVFLRWKVHLPYLHHSFWLIWLIEISEFLIFSCQIQFRLRIGIIMNPVMLSADGWQAAMEEVCHININTKWKFNIS